MEPDGDTAHGELLGSLHDLLLRAEDLDELLTGVAVLGCKLVEAPCVSAVTVEVAGRPVTATSADGPVPAVPSWSVALPSTEVAGRLNVYVDEGRRSLEAASLRALEDYARLAGPVVGLAVRREEQQLLHDQLVTALASRTVIDQAIGVLMGQERCSAEEAFDLLRRHSQNTNRKLRDVATEIITRTTGHPPSDPKPFGAWPAPGSPEVP